MPHRPVAIACCLISLLCQQAVHAAPSIVTSIEPLRVLAAALAEGVSEPESLIPGQASIHHFALRPSQLAQLRDADLVVWIDRRFEAGFSRIEALLSATTARLELGPQLALHSDDFHLWYSPRLLLASARSITEALIALDPEHAERYRENAARLESAIATRSETLQRRLRLDGPLLLTEHAFLHGFAEEFGFSAIVALTDEHEGGGSLGDLQRLEERLAARPASCLLTTGTVASPLGIRLAGKYRLDIVSLQLADPSGQPLGHLDRLLEALQSCNFAG